jgi:hypothetical protein
MNQLVLRRQQPTAQQILTVQEFLNEHRELPPGPSGELVSFGAATMIFSQIE